MENAPLLAEQRDAVKEFVPLARVAATGRGGNHGRHGRRQYPDVTPAFGSTVDISRHAAGQVPVETTLYGHVQCSDNVRRIGNLDDWRQFQLFYLR